MRYTLVYDGHCRVCNRFVDGVRQWDRGRELDLVPQAEDVTTRFPWIPPAAFAEAMQLVGPGGETWQGAAALEQLLIVLPRGRWIAWVFRIPFARALAERFYRWFARNRYRMGCGEHCRPQPRNPRG